MFHLKRSALAVTVALLAGCATGPIVWDKPGSTEAERERDENACLRVAIGTDGGTQLLAPYCIDRESTPGAWRRAATPFVPSKSGPERRTLETHAAERSWVGT